MDSKTVISGSHYDSVVQGGAFDGIAGVICALEGCASPDWKAAAS